MWVVELPFLPLMVLAYKVSKTYQLTVQIQEIFIKQAHTIDIQLYVLIYMLSRQGSNLDSSEPKSDVLPVTPRDSCCFGGWAKLKKKRFVRQGLHAYSDTALSYGCCIKRKAGRGSRTAQYSI